MKLHNGEYVWKKTRDWGKKALKRDGREWEYERILISFGFKSSHGERGR